MSCTRYDPSPVARCASCRTGLCECGGCSCPQPSHRCRALPPAEHEAPKIAGVDLNFGPHFCGGPKRNVLAMIEATAHLRDVGGLPGPAALVLSQLLLNLGGHAGRGRALQLVELLLTAADVPPGFVQ